MPCVTQKRHFQAFCVFDLIFSLRKAYVSKQTDIMEINGMGKPLFGGQKKGYSFQFVGDCRNLQDHGKATWKGIQQMKRDAREISMSTFERKCGPVDFAYLSDMEADPGSGFYHSRLDGEDCYFIGFAGFEFIYLKRPDKT